MALADAIIKASAGGMTLWQIRVLRSALVLPVPYLMARGRVGLASAASVALRSLALVGMYPALPLIDIALAGETFYTAPLFIVALSALILGNRETARHWLAILTGVAGLPAIVRPFAAAFTPLVPMPVAAATFHAVPAILTRAECATVAPVVLGFWLNLAFSGFGLAALPLLSPGPDLPWDYPFLTGARVPATAEAWAVMATLALLMPGIAIGVARAYQSPRPEVVASSSMPARSSPSSAASSSSARRRPSGPRSGRR